MVEIKEIKDARYCCSCGKSEDVYEIVAETEVSQGRYVSKYVPLCSDCLKKLMDDPVMRKISGS